MFQLNTNFGDRRGIPLGDISNQTNNILKPTANSIGLSPGFTKVGVPSGKIGVPIAVSSTMISPSPGIPGQSSGRFGQCSSISSEPVISQGGGIAAQSLSNCAPTVCITPNMTAKSLTIDSGSQYPSSQRTSLTGMRPCELNSLPQGRNTTRNSISGNVSLSNFGAFPSSMSQTNNTHHNLSNVQSDNGQSNQASNQVVHGSQQSGSSNTSLAPRDTSLLQSTSSTQGLGFRKSGWGRPVLPKKFLKNLGEPHIIMQSISQDHPASQSQKGQQNGKRDGNTNCGDHVGTVASASNGSGENSFISSTESGHNSASTGINSGHSSTGMHGGSSSNIIVSRMGLQQVIPIQGGTPGVTPIPCLRRPALSSGNIVPSNSGHSSTPFGYSSTPYATKTPSFASSSTSAGNSLGGNPNSTSLGSNPNSTSLGSNPIASPFLNARTNSGRTEDPGSQNSSMIMTTQSSNVSGQNNPIANAGQNGSRSVNVNSTSTSESILGGTRSPFAFQPRQMMGPFRSSGSFGCSKSVAVPRSPMTWKSVSAVPDAKRCISPLALLPTNSMPISNLPTASTKIASELRSPRPCGPIGQKSPRPQSQKSPHPLGQKFPHPLGRKSPHRLGQKSPRPPVSIGQKSPPVHGQQRSPAAQLLTPALVQGSASRVSRQTSPPLASAPESPSEQPPFPEILPCGSSACKSDTHTSSNAHSRQHSPLIYAKRQPFTEVVQNGISTTNGIQNAGQSSPPTEGTPPRKPTMPVKDLSNSSPGKTDGPGVDVQHMPIELPKPSRLSRGRPSSTRKKSRFPHPGLIPHEYSAPAPIPLAVESAPNAREHPQARSVPVPKKSVRDGPSYGVSPVKELTEIELALKFVQAFPDQYADWKRNMT